MAPPHCPALLLAMQYDMRPDRLGWTLLDVTSGRPVVWDDVPLTGIEQEAAYELLVRDGTFRGEMSERYAR